MRIPYLELQMAMSKLFSATGGGRSPQEGEPTLITVDIASDRKDHTFSIDLEYNLDRRDWDVVFFEEVEEAENNDQNPNQEQAE